MNWVYGVSAKKVNDGLPALVQYLNDHGCPVASVTEASEVEDAAVMLDVLNRKIHVQVGVGGTYSVVEERRDGTLSFSDETRAVGRVVLEVLRLKREGAK